MHKRQILRGGFALPTVLIASVVMLTVLATAVSSVAAVRTTLKAQYYEQLAKAAGEAGVAYAKACLAKNGNRPLWTSDKPLKPSTDCAGNELLSPAVQVLVVAGGGGGGHNHGGGGGGGGVQTEDVFSVAAGQSYSIVVGGGGAGGSTGGNAGANGGNSSIAGLIVAVGGGGGGGRIATNSVSQAKVGGSGGGGAGTLDGSSGQAGAGGAGTPGQGYSGGRGSSGSLAGNGGGGGGAGQVGGAASGTESSTGVTGSGGPGLGSNITGATIYYGGGGSGGHWAAGSVGAPGITGGGRGGNDDGVAGLPGIANTGGGGGGGGGGAALGGNGGSGAVVIRYGNTGSIAATGGIESVAGAYKIHKFHSVGTSTFTVTSANNASCPEDPRCSVVSNSTLRSSFTVTSPTLDSQGRALTIPNNGYVELLRTSTGAVWRTYRQPAVQAAAVPDLCSGSASSGLGWQNSVASSTSLSVPGSTSAQAITLVDAPLPAGKIYFRKDFTVNSAGTYSLTATTPSARDSAVIYVDGSQVGITQGSLLNTPVNLSAGCHIITVELTNITLGPKATSFAAGIQQGGSAPLVETDTSWRVSSGEGVHFSQSDYYADPAIWSTVVPYPSQTAQVASSAWQTTQSDVFTGFISPPGNGCSSLCPSQQSGYMRDSKDFILTQSREVQISSLCDDDCSVFLDGEMVIANSPWSAINQQSLTLTPGPHRIGVRIYNTPATAGPSGAAVSVVDKASGEVYTRTDRTWQGSNVWIPGLNVTTEDIRAYEDSFRPSPDEIPRNNSALDVLIVAGGGGGGSNAGGGGGGGGVVNLANLSVETGTYNVSIGAGGVAGLNSGTATTSRGQNGGNSIFGSFTAVGGGGGASRDWGPNPSVGGSGGGGSGSGGNAPTSRYQGASGTAGQGHSGGDGTPADSGSTSKGGGGGGASGAGVVGNTTTAGNGGSGFITYITGARQSFAGGGGGANTASNGFLGAATDGGVGGVSTAAPANRGGGGSGIAGVGGSGVVIVRVKQTPTLDFDFTGPVTFGVTSINGQGYSIMTFTGNGTFSIYSY